MFCQRKSSGERSTTVGRKVRFLLSEAVIGDYKKFPNTGMIETTSLK